MTDVASAASESAPAPVRQLTRSQRRVLGVLVEKAMTTPDQYPLTLKSATTACNQKSNREPITNYTEEQVENVLNELRKLGLAAVVHTESGRTERFRHYVRKVYPVSEPQLAILAELWLRGRQQPGELRSRASRMVTTGLDSIEQLRAEMQPLVDQGYVQASGSLERRGIEVDHTFYLPDEGKRLEPTAGLDDDEDEPAVSPRPSREPAGAPSSEWRVQCEALAERVARLEQQASELQETVDRIRRELGLG